MAERSKLREGDVVVVVYPASPVERPLLGRALQVVRTTHHGFVICTDGDLTWWLCAVALQKA